MALYIFIVACISVLIYNSYCDGLDKKYKETRLQIINIYIFFKINVLHKQTKLPFIPVLVQK